MRSLSLEIEAGGGHRRTARRSPPRSRKRLREALGLDVPVRTWSSRGRLPRFEMKARRFVRGGRETMTSTGNGSGDPDVVVIGGGPAGRRRPRCSPSRAAGSQLFERERFPRFHIGESLIPETYWVLKRLNMLTR